MRTRELVPEMQIPDKTWIGSEPDSWVNRPKPECIRRQIQRTRQLDLENRRDGSRELENQLQRIRAVVIKLSQRDPNYSKWD